MASNDVIPDVPAELKPNYDMMFKTLEDAIQMYKIYAEKAGFDVRLNTQKINGDIVQHKYLICSRSGKVPQKSADYKRNTRCKVTDCKAKIVVKRANAKGDYKFDKFSESHNHELLDKSELKESRKLSYSDKEFIIRASTIKNGAIRAHKMKAALNGGIQNVKGKVVDYKNFKRDLGTIISFKDAQMIVNKMRERRDNYTNYSFFYRLDDNKRLNAMFWADETDKAYYSEFGDILSLDATFRTNKYKMVFVPFTVINHHKSSVTVGAGLLSKETIDSYVWLLKKFLEAHGKQPRLVVTDQDPALKQAIETEFPESKHRLCMWHIMKKLQKKVSVDFLKKTDFKKKFKKLVWDVKLEPDEFVKKWKELMIEFKLQKKAWFKDIFKKRHSWIPAYFKEIPLCCLMKTTSRSESINSFFNSYSQSDNFLCYFMMNYDNAIQKQRNNQWELDHQTKIAQYIFKTPRTIEKHAAAVYTSEVFFELQKEFFMGSWFCEVSGFVDENGLEVYTVMHSNKRSEFRADYKVELNVADEEIRYSFEHFMRFGLLCRHSLKGSFAVRDQECTKMVNKAFFNIESCLDLVRHNKEKLAEFVDKTEVLLIDLKKDSSNVSSNNNKNVVEKLIGVSIPEEVEIHVPDVQNNKGCGRKRMVGELEKAILKSQKKTRKCSGCGLKEPHNLRTCPSRIAKEKEKEKEKDK